MNRGKITSLFSHVIGQQKFHLSYCKKTSWQMSFIWRPCRVHVVSIYPAVIFCIRSQKKRLFFYYLGQVWVIKSKLALQWIECTAALLFNTFSTVATFSSQKYSMFSCLRRYQSSDCFWEAESFHDISMQTKATTILYRDLLPQAGK